ncbi:S-adenosyl-L-methionine-dependent methyltransferase [Annulohypoxylon maeteangense]|uniref:S-adenosyl-L-methionine-dependent methyltransferase n=1 Tax=Annulohypoxylon maeteangense TaxID=1927788 RepID=UPI0020083B7D|nr:S-adenosyl-L-methionine-dependent methyltransferase [Annulohypoxylon maeteangense]KAI0888674.1 S-adenosyl-L-methionine-dependent methyltransferase [Annulohypoxylon maeteangense]
METMTPRIIELVRILSDSVTEVQAALSKKNHPSPSFDEDTPASIPPDLSDLQDKILDASAELHDLFLQPINLIYKYGSHNNTVCLQAISRFDIANLVPARGQISFDDIAKTTGLGPVMTRRMLRYAMTMRVFQEPEPDMVAHTKASKALTDIDASNWLKGGCEEMWPTALKIVNTVTKWPDSQSPKQLALALANNGGGGFYDIIANDVARAVRFSGTMKTFANSPAYNPKFIVEHYDWGSLGPNAHIVDMGGARGHIAIAITGRFPGLRATVQDLGHVIKGAEKEVPPGLRGRVVFMEHNLFQPQPVQGADVYYVRWVLHNWSDENAINLLRALVPVLKKGSRVVINETCMPEPRKIPLWRERNLRSADLNMGAIFNARERTVTEWKALITEADTRFLLKQVIQPKGSALAIMEVLWDGNAEAGA